MLEGSGSFHPSKCQGIASCLLAPQVHFLVGPCPLESKGGNGGSGRRDQRAAQVKAEGQEPCALQLAVEQDAARSSAQAQSAKTAAGAGGTVNLSRRTRHCVRFLVPGPGSYSQSAKSRATSSVHSLWHNPQDLVSAEKSHLSMAPSVLREGGLSPYPSSGRILQKGLCCLACPWPSPSLQVTRTTYLGGLYDIGERGAAIKIVLAAQEVTAVTYRHGHGEPHVLRVRDP